MVGFFFVLALGFVQISCAPSVRKMLPSPSTQGFEGTPAHESAEMPHGVVHPIEDQPAPVKPATPQIPDPSTPTTPEPAPQSPAPPVAPADHSDLPTKQVVIPAKAEKYRWLADSIEVHCNVKSCPPSVGILIFMRDRVGETQNYERCTATLIAEDLIVSAGHCDYFPAVGFFVVGSGESKQYRTISKVDYKAWSEGKNHQVLLQPDIAFFHLNSPIKSIPVSPVTDDKAQSAFDRMTAYVINDGPKVTGDSTIYYNIDSVTCGFQKTQTFPFDNYEGPTLFRPIQCPAVQGNSGSPFFASGDPRIQAILQDIFAETSEALAANLHCLYKPESCVSVSDASVQTRLKPGS